MRQSWSLISGSHRGVAPDQPQVSSSRVRLSLQVDRALRQLLSNQAPPKGQIKGGDLGRRAVACWGVAQLGWQVGAGSLAGKVTEEIIVTRQEPCGWAAVLGRTAFVGAQSLADVSGELHGRGPVLRHLGVAHSRCAGRAQCEQGKARQGQGHQHLDHRQAVLTAQLHADTPLARSAARPCIETHTTRTKLALPAPLGVRIKLWAAARAIPEAW